MSTIATAKHDCVITVTTSLDIISLNKRKVSQGEILNYQIYQDKKIEDTMFSVILGERSVVFKDNNGLLLITYSKDFTYTEL